MDDTKQFPTWLQAQGLTSETARAVLTELDIRSPGALDACSESLAMKAELFSLAKQKMPFAMYAELRCFVECRWERQHTQAGNPMLVSVLHSMLITVSRELSSCAQKLISLDSLPDCHSRQPAHSGDLSSSPDCHSSQPVNLGEADLRILDVCSLHHQNESVNSELEGMDPGMEEQHLYPNAVGPIFDALSQTAKETDRHDHYEHVYGSTHIDAGDIVALEDENFHNDIATSSQEILNNVQVKQEHDNNENLGVSTNSAAETSSEKARLFSCSRCSHLFLTEGALQLHMNTRHKKGCLYKCAVCGKNFSTKQNVKIHNRIHTGERPYKCSVCGKSFTAKNSVTIHMRTHTGERPFECSVCGRTFTVARHVTSHMKTHTGERPHKCFVCGKSFSEKSSVKIHMRTHTGERPYKCSICGKGFSARNSVKIHMSTHSLHKNVS
uniref:zinc finger protein 37A-like n=1 Tax=Myxine glutinosa TaxID=7769 RepID=UPI00358E1439